jgi:hypothetical protein
LWLLDGALQFQPYMFSKEFMAGILGMANMGLPGFLGHADFRVAILLAAHPAFWNAVFASVQVALGAGLIFGRGRVVDAARGASIVWALGVWVIGEGAGGMFMGGTSLLTGAPGAALLYALVAIMVWPPRIRAGAGRALWAVVWTGSALLELVGINHASGVPGAQITDGAFREPGPVAAADRAVGHLVAGQGALFAVCLLVAAIAIGAGALSDRTLRPALIAGGAVAIFIATAGQNVGQVLTGQGTDPGTGPLLILMAFSLWTPAHRTLATSGSVGRRRFLVAATAPG